MCNELYSAIKSDREVPKTRIDLLKGMGHQMGGTTCFKNMATLNVGGEGILIITVRKVSSIVWASTDNSTQYEKVAYMRIVHISCAVIVVDGTEDILQPVWGDQIPSNMDGSLNAFKRVLVETSDKQCDFGLHTLKCVYLISW